MSTAVVGWRTTSSLDGRLGHQGVEEPGQVLTHEAARQVVGWLDGAPGRRKPAFAAHPSVAAGRDPLVQADRVGTVVIGDGGRQGELAARVVEDQEVGLVEAVDPTAEGPGVHDVDADGGIRVLDAVDDALEHAEAPGPSPMMAISITAADARWLVPFGRFVGAAATLSRSMTRPIAMMSLPLS